MIVSKGVLKAKMFDYLRQVEKTNEELIITDRHKPVLKIIPFKKKKNPLEVFAEFQGKVTYKEDITTPTTDEWDDV